MAYRIIASNKLVYTGPDEDYDTICEPYMTAAVVETDEGQDLTDEEKDRIYDYMRRSCSCPGDCCGHYTGGVNSITKVWEGRYVVLASYTRNY